MFRTLCYLLVLALPLAASGQVYNQWPVQASSFDHVIAPATPAIRTPKGSAGVITGVECTNTTSATVYIHFYNNASPTLGTTADSWSVGCPGNTGGGGIVHEYTWARTMSTAISWSVTGGISATDNTSITASSVDVTVGYN